jgi:hypothetical protein
MIWWYWQEKTTVLAEIPSQCHFVRHNFKLILTMHEDSICTSQRTLVFIINTSWLILCSEIRAACSENHIEKHMNTEWEKKGGIYSYRCVLECVWRWISHSFLRLVLCYAGGWWPRYLEVSSALSVCFRLAHAASSTAISRYWATSILSTLCSWLRPTAAEYRHVMRVPYAKCVQTSARTALYKISVDPQRFAGIFNNWFLM